MVVNSKWRMGSGSIVATLLMLSLSNSTSVVAQAKNPTTESTIQTEQNDGQRGDIYSSDYFTGTRPDSKNPNTAKFVFQDRQSTRNRRALPKGKIYIKIGVTIGRGRPATEIESTDRDIAKVRVCLERKDKDCIRSQEMVVERISDNTLITQGTPIQMIVEYLASKDEAGTKQQYNRVGYLYVINRVEFPNGKTSPPRLIFPTKLTFGGGNVIVPGKPVMLPDPRQLWQISRNKVATQEYETYIIIVSPEPLKDAQGRELQGDNLSTTPRELDETLVRDWVRRWGGGEIPADLVGGVGQLFTHKEQTASGDPTMTSRDTDTMDSDLKKDDPQPQIAFRKAIRKAIRPSTPMLITIKLPFKDSANPDALK